MAIQTLPETEHFRIEHNPYNIGTHWKQYSVQPKRDKTSDSRAMTPMPASADTAEALIDELLQAEEWYVRNRYGIDRKAELIDVELAEFRSQISTVQKRLREEAALLDSNLAVLEAFIAEGGMP